MRIKPAFLLNHVRHVKSAFGNLNVRFTKLAFLKLHFSNATISSARSVLLIRDTRPALLQLYVGPRRPAFLKYRYPDATISSARAASLPSRGSRLTFQSQNARAAFILQDVSSTSQNLASQLCEARIILTS